MIYRSCHKEHDRLKLAIIDHFFLFTPLKTQSIKILKKQKKLQEISSFYTCVPKITIIWCITIYYYNHNLRFWTIFALLPSKNLQKQNFENTKKITGDITSLHKCTKNHNHIMYGSWDVERSRQNFLWFWIFFCPSNPLTTLKIKMFKTLIKTSGDVIILQMCMINDNHMMYGSWDMEHDAGLSLKTHHIHDPHMPKEQF